MQRSLLLILPAILLVFSPYVEAAAGTEGAAFLDIPVGAGPAAMGSAYTALATDAYAPIYNPAGLAKITRPEGSAQHLAYLESIHYEALSGVIPLGKSRALGAAAQYLGTGDIQALSASAEPVGSYSSHYGAYSLAYGQGVTEHLSLGLTGKWIEAKLADTHAQTYAADLSAQIQPTLHQRWVVSFRHLGKPLQFEDQKDSLPAAVHVAGAYEPSHSWSLAAEMAYKYSGLMSGRVGLQWSPIQQLSLRAGYRTDTIAELGALAGMSVGMGFQFWHQELAYAWLPYGELGDTHYLSLVMRFGESVESRRNLIQYDRIKRHRASGQRGSGAETGDVEQYQLMRLLQEGKPTVASGEEYQKP